ncbi:MAG: tetratricopeptide repeat protein [Nitrospirota bacterium]
MQRNHTWLVLAAMVLTGAAACYNKPSDAPPAPASSSPSAGQDPGAPHMPSAGSAEALAPPPGANAEAANAINEGNGHYALGHFDAAAGWYEDALKADANSAEAHFNLALALDKMGHHEEAAVHFEEANRLGADNPAITGSEILKKHIGA